MIYLSCCFHCFSFLLLLIQKPSFKLGPIQVINSLDLLLLLFFVAECVFVSVVIVILSSLGKIGSCCFRYFLSQKLSSKSLVKIGSVIDELLFLLFLLMLLFLILLLLLLLLLILQTHLLSLVKIRSGTAEILRHWVWMVVVVGGLTSFSCQTQLLS